MITMTLTAETAAEFREQLMALAGQYHLDFAPAEQKPQAAPLASVNVVEAYKPTQTKKTRQRAPVAPPVPIAAPVEEATADSFEDFIEDVADEPPAPAAKTLIDIKAKTMATLQQAFADGKVDKLRDILVTYGGGAKSFPEIDAAAFADIAQAIKAGALDA